MLSQRRSCWVLTTPRKALGRRRKLAQCHVRTCGTFSNAFVALPYDTGNKIRHPPRRIYELMFLDKGESANDGRAMRL